MIEKTPSNAELPFVSERSADEQLSRMLRRQPEGESIEIARIKLLDEFDDLMQHMRLSTYKNMRGIDEELAFISQELTNDLDFFLV